MRNIIIGLSIFFLALSGIVTYKTLKIPSNNVNYQNNPQGLKSREHLPEAEDNSGQFAKEQTAKLKDKISDKNVKTNEIRYQNNPRELKSKEPLPKAEDNLRQFAKEQVAKRVLVEELRADKAELKDELSEKNEKIQANVGTKGYSKKARVLAVFGDGTFHSGQFVVDNNLKTAVHELVPHIMASPDYHVIIEGHTDNLRPSNGKRYIDNMELSFLRAKAVAFILVENGISPERISVIGYGDTRPAASNETIEGRAKNRRVEVKLIPGDKEF
jgi:flagellar motor protein MotB